MGPRLAGLMALVCAILAAAELTPAERQLNIDSFEHIWSTVRESHWDPALGGLDWKAVHDELLPLVQKAATMAEARQAMRDMLGRLHESHFAVIPGEVYRDVGDSGGGEDVAGIEIRVVKGAALVTAVDEGSPAARAGVRRGWQIVQIRGVDVAPFIEGVDGAYRDSTLREMMLARAVSMKLVGNSGERIGVRFLDGAGKTVDLEIGLVPARGEIARFGNLPPQHVWIESRKLDEKTGYIAFNLFLDPARLMAAFEEAVKSFQKMDGIVIDLRGNPGGIGLMAMGMAGWFIDKQSQQLGTMTMRQTPLHFVVNPRMPAFRGRVAILVDGGSASTSEIFAGGMQDLKRARIFGTRTAGAALPSIIERLPNGDGFQYAAADYVSQSGKRLEGAGVVPDVEAPHTRELLLAGKDAALEAAINWVHTK